MNPDVHSSAEDPPVPHLCGEVGGKSLRVTRRDLEGALRVLDAVVTLYGKTKAKKTTPGKKKRKRAADGKEEGAEGVAEGSAEGSAENGAENGTETTRSYRDPSLRPLRKSLVSAYVNVQSQFMYGDGVHGSLEAYRQQKGASKDAVSKTARETALQRAYVDTTALRRGRIERLHALLEDGRGAEEAKERLALLVPDGPVEVSARALPPSEDDRPSGARPTSTEITVAPTAPGPAATLPKPRSCYACKRRFTKLHHFYDQLCETCAAFNYANRDLTADLTGRVAVVTGARVKIGYHTCLKLLRAGCTVVATTRFPNAACKSYMDQPDFHSFKDRLHVFGLDFRDITGLEAFTLFLRKHYQKVDILINNACQTIRRPAGYYTPAVQKEMDLYQNASKDHHMLLAGTKMYESTRRRLSAPPPDKTAALEGASLPQIAPPPVENALAPSSPFHLSGVACSALLSQTSLLPEDAVTDRSLLPPGLSDVNGQQLDLRRHNSWLLKLQDVSTPEVVETFFVNAIAPFVLNSRLHPLLTAGGEGRPARYIVNVSAMEGKFYRYKTPRHPHTNMAKAALNMLTRTSAEDLAKRHRVYMNSVDTGWINDENPTEAAARIAKENHFQTPIDEIDAAARILHPVFMGVREGRTDYGKFYKDYKETEW